MSSLKLKSILTEIPKAELQRYFLHWFPGRDLLSSKDRLRKELTLAMTDFQTVRDRFNNLTRSQQTFLSVLLVREKSFAATVEEVLSGAHAGSIEGYEIESLLKTLREAGYIVRMPLPDGDAREVFSIPAELADALKCTISVDDRTPLQMLSLRSRNDVTQLRPEEGALENVAQRLDAIEDPELRSMARRALEDYGGLLTLSECQTHGLLETSEEAGGATGLERAGWREQLERCDLGTIGVVALKNYGLDIEEQTFCIYQELVHAHGLRQAELAFEENDREVSVSVDLIIDLEHLPELLNKESNYLTREGRVYKKVEAKLGSKLVIGHYREFIESSPVQYLFELGRKIRLFDREGKSASVDLTRRRAWQKQSLLEKVEQLFSVCLGDERDQHWSFHQTQLRQMFLGQVQETCPGGWLVAKPFLDAIVARYLAELDGRQVREGFEQLLQGDFRHQKLVVPVRALLQDLSYWVFHRVALLGLIDVGFRDGSFYSFRLSRLGMRLFEVDVTPELADSPRLLVNPDFELLVYPEAPEEWNWIVSRFAERLGSDYVKRYRVSRDSLKRALSYGWGYKEIVDFLQQNAFGSVPPNVIFAIREWTEGIELVRQRRALLLRSQSNLGADRLEEVLERHQISYERLTDTVVTVHGVKNEQAVKALQAEFLDWGLIVE